MGVVKKIVDDFERKVTGTNTIGHFWDQANSTLDPGGIVNDVLIREADRIVAGTTEEQLTQAMNPQLPEVEAEYGSRTSPSVIKTDANVDLEDEDELEEDIILGKSKRNRLRVPITGGVQVPTAGASGTSTGATPSSAGLSIG